MNVEAYDLDTLRKLVRDLQAENKSLKERLAENHIPFESDDVFESVNRAPDDYDPDQASLIEPIIVTDDIARRFYGMFWGRTDVYARRGKNGGYFPQCKNRWNDELCPKQKGKHFDCGECRNQNYEKLELWHIRQHLQGLRENCTDVIGVYPLLPDGSCRFLVFDFDNHEKGADQLDNANSDDAWRDEVDALRRICEICGIDALTERSRSGRGAHVWIFFKQPVPASLARRFGFALLDKGCESINLTSFRFYDRMYPSQDSVQSLGNLVALPLQGQALKNGNSAFVDKAWNAYPDQMEALGRIKRLGLADIDALLTKWETERMGRPVTSAYLHGQERLKPWKRNDAFHAEDVAMVGSVYRKGEIFPEIDRYGLVIMDECHHAASAQAQQVLRRVKAKYVYGVSATPVRSDKLEKINYMMLGPIRHQYTPKEHALTQGIDLLVRPRFTRVVDFSEERLEIHRAYELISDSGDRNRQITEDVRDCIREGRTPVVLTRLKKHAKLLYDNLSDAAQHVFLLYGDNTQNQNQEIRRKMLEVPKDESMLLIATGQKIGEGFDCPRLDTLMLASPVKFDGRLIQYVGRLNRSYEGKRDVVVYDYVDAHIGIFDNQYRNRLAAYKKIGYRIQSDTAAGHQSVNAIYDRGNYTEVFERDLVEAEQEIVIASPSLRQQKVERVISLLKPRQEAGIKVAVITLHPDCVRFGDPVDVQLMIDRLRRAGISVSLTDSESEHFAVIDKKLVWHGGMNLLGKEDAWDNLIRVESVKTAAELLEMTKEQTERA